MRLRVDEEAVIDSSGVRRQVYGRVIETIGKGYLEIFEGPLNRLRPTCKPSNIASGLLKNFGKAVAHSLVMDQVGFPHLSSPIYFYMVGYGDVAVTHLKGIDAGGLLIS